jgi:hypothetical protein
MSTSALRIVLRSAAIVIAIAAVIDPVFSLERPITPPVVLIDMTDGSLDEIRDTLRERAAATVIERETTGHRIPCAPGERCVIVADGTVHAERSPAVGHRLGTARSCRELGSHRHRRQGHDRQHHHRAATRWGADGWFGASRMEIGRNGNP